MRHCTAAAPSSLGSRMIAVPSHPGPFHRASQAVEQHNATQCHRAMPLYRGTVVAWESRSPGSPEPIIIPLHNVYLSVEVGNESAQRLDNTRLTSSPHSCGRTHTRISNQGEELDITYIYTCTEAYTANLGILKTR